MKSITVLLRIDNTTAVAYVNKLGGTVSIKLSQGTMALVHEPGFYTLVAEHLPEVLNTNMDQRFPSNDGPVRLDVESQDLQRDPAETLGLHW